MAKIFISYRRADTAKMSRRIYDELIKRTSKWRVFRDVDTLMKGKDFRADIIALECEEEDVTGSNIKS